MKILLTLSIIMIILNAVPRINDLVAADDYSPKQVARMLSLVTIVLTGVWFILALFWPSKIPVDWAATLMLMAIATAWTCSPLVENWWAFVFHHGEPNRLEKLGRRKSDRVPPGGGL